eukprot:158714_1
MSETHVPIQTFTSISIILFVFALIPGFAYFIAYSFGGEIRKLQAYFTYNTILTIVFNILCATFVMIYFIWLWIDPLQSDEMYWTHEANVLRIILTVLFTIGKMFPFFIYNGRLRYVFQIGKYGTSKSLFRVLNAIVILLTPLSLTLGYCGVFVYPNDTLEWLGFNGYRIVYIMLLLLLSWLFNKRIIIMLIEQARLAHTCISKIRLTPKQSSSLRGRQKLISHTEEESQDSDGEEKELAVTSPTLALDEQERVQFMEFLNIVTKSSVLLSFMIVSKIVVMTAWFTHNYVFGHAHQSLCIGFLCMSLDCVVDEICILLLYKHSERFYALLCACSKEGDLTDGTLHKKCKCGAHSCFSRCCARFAACYSKRCYHSEQ